jgi:hypothetical protein
LNRFPLRRERPGAANNPSEKFPDNCLRHSGSVVSIIFFNFYGKKFAQKYSPDEN